MLTDVIGVVFVTATMGNITLHVFFSQDYATFDYIDTNMIRSLLLSLWVILTVELLPARVYLLSDFVHFYASAHLCRRRRQYAIRW